MCCGLTTLSTGLVAAIALRALDLDSLSTSGGNNVGSLIQLFGRDDVVDFCKREGNSKSDAMP